MKSYLLVLGVIVFFVMMLFTLDFFLLGEDSGFANWQEELLDTPDWEVEDKEWWDIAGHIGNFFTIVGNAILSVCIYVANAITLFWRVLILDVVLLSKLGFLQWLIKVPIWATLSYAVVKVIRG